MIHVKWSSPNFKVDLDHENDNIMKNGFYQRILQPSEYPKRVGAKKKFFQTLLDGPYWLDSDLIPRLLENFENWKNFMVILFNVKNDAYRRIFGA